MATATAPASTTAAASITTNERRRLLRPAPGSARAGLCDTDSDTIATKYPSPSPGARWAAAAPISGSPRRAHTIPHMTGLQWPLGEPGPWLRRGVLLLVLAALVAGSAPEALPDRFRAQGLAVAAGPKIQLEVAGQPQWVPLGWTLADAIQHFRLQAPAGNLMAADGGVLRHAAFPGQVLLNGEAAPHGTVLDAGAAITMHPGPNRVEPLDRLELSFGPTEPHDPQFSLETGPGSEILTSGAISHRGAHYVFQPTGAVTRPNAVALTLGSHSFSHPQPFGALSKQDMQREIDQGVAALSDLGVRTALFRPPGGAIPPLVVSIARAKGLRTIVWTVDPDDWKRGTTADQIVQRVLQQTKPGSIVLLHDGGGDRSATVEALPRIIDGLKKRHLAFVTL